MVMLRTNKPVITYEVYDEHGQSVGCVILPRSSRVVGPSEGTVLLRRSTPSHRSRSRATPERQQRKAS